MNPLLSPQKNKSPQKLTTKLSVYQGPNPFVHTLPFTFYEKCKIFLFIISGILIVKVIFFIIMLLFAYIGAIFKLLICGDRYSWTFNMYIRGLSRLCLFFVFGFYYIPTNQLNQALSRWPKIITPNHIAIFDSLLILYLTGAVFVAKKELRDIPIVGTLMTALGCVFVDRSTKATRRDIVNIIKAHCTNDNNPPLCIFPEGTNSNGSVLISFKAGAFIPGVPCLPTTIQYTNRYGDLSLFGDDGFNALHASCQFINFVSIQFLQIYRPSEEEQEDALLYAFNVRDQMAKALNVVTTSHTFEDSLISKFTEKMKKKEIESHGVAMMEQTPFLMQEVRDKLQMNAKTVLHLSEYFMEYCNDQGIVTVDTFAAVFKIKDRTLAHTLFELFSGERELRDIDSVVTSSNEEGEEEERVSIQDKRCLTFADFLVGIAVCTRPDLLDDAIIVLFSIVDLDGDGLVSTQDIEEGIGRELDDDIKKVLGEVDGDLSFEEFRDRLHREEMGKVVQKRLCLYFEECVCLAEIAWQKIVLSF